MESEEGLMDELRGGIKNFIAKRLAKWEGSSGTHKSRMSEVDKVLSVETLC